MSGKQYRPWLDAAFSEGRLEKIGLNGEFRLFLLTLKFLYFKQTVQTLIRRRVIFNTYVVVNIYMFIILFMVALSKQILYLWQGVLLQKGAAKSI